MVATDTILAVDDDVYILRMLKRLMEGEGFAVITASNGDEALAIYSELDPDLMLLDITMPMMSGITVCECIREFSHVPIIMLTARGSVDDIALGLKSGADDYVVKPFSNKELVARIKANLRRSRAWERKDTPVFRLDDLAVDFAASKVTVAGNEIDLTATEYRIISYLAQNAGRILTPDQILAEIWGESYCGESHILQVNIARLRKKIEKDQNEPVYILTRPGIGYMMGKEG